MKANTQALPQQADALPALKPRRPRWSQKQHVVSLEIEPGITCSHIANTDYFLLTGSAAALSASSRYSQYVLPAGRMMREAGGVKVTRARNSDEHRIWLHHRPLHQLDEYPLMAAAMAVRDAAPGNGAVKPPRVRLVSSQSPTQLAAHIATNGVRQGDAASLRVVDNDRRLAIVPSAIPRTGSSRGPLDLDWVTDGVTAFCGVDRETAAHAACAIFNVIKSRGEKVQWRS